jgi:hypothetical protein
VSDQWFDGPEPLADLADPGDVPGSISVGQYITLRAALLRMGIETYPARAAWLAERFGPGVRLIEDLSYNQAGDALQETA